MKASWREADLRAEVGDLFQSWGCGRGDSPRSSGEGTGGAWGRAGDSRWGGLVDGVRAFRAQGEDGAVEAGGVRGPVAKGEGGLRDMKRLAAGCVKGVLGPCQLGGFK